MVFNLKTNTLDLGNQQASKYKFNKEISPPEPESPECETRHEVRRNEMRRLFHRALKETNNKSNDKPQLNAEGKGNVKSKSNNISPDFESNLSMDELKGLKSLKKKLRMAML